MMCAPAKYIGGVSVSANCQKFCGRSSALMKKLLAPSTSIVEKDFNTGYQHFHKNYFHKEIGCNRIILVGDLETSSCASS